MADPGASDPARNTRRKAAQAFRATVARQARARRYGAGVSIAFYERTPSGGKRALVFGVGGNRGGTISDPALTWSYQVRAMLRPPDPFRQPSVCRRIDPKTGAVIETLDPFTRKPATSVSAG